MYPSIFWPTSHLLILVRRILAIADALHRVGAASPGNYIEVGIESIKARRLTANNPHYKSRLRSAGSL